jgi:hypothetical protein
LRLADRSGDPLDRRTLDPRVLEDARDAPVEHVHLAEVAEHDVLGLEVAVNHTTAVGERYGLAHATHRRQQAPPRVGLRGGGVAAPKPLDDCGEGEAVDPLHREERRAVGPRPEVVDRDDAGVLELPLHQRLAHEPGP